MPSPGSKNLGQRHQKGIGLTQYSALGARAADFPISALDPRGEWAVTCLDFGKESIPNANAFAAAPYNLTVTSINTPNNPSIIADALNGYLLINPGDAADDGYNIQNNVADTNSKNLMKFIATGNASLSAGREIVWGMRFGVQNTSTSVFDSKFFVGLNPTDTALVVNTDGTLDTVSGIGFHCNGDTGTGAINLVCGDGTNVETLATGFTAMSMCQGGAVATALRPLDFHDFVFYAKWNALAGTTGTDVVEAYVDGRYVGRISGNTILPDLTSVSLFNSLSVLTGPAQDMDMGVVAIWNGTRRLAQRLNP